VRNGKIDLNLEKGIKMKFDISKASRKSTTRGQNSGIHDMDVDTGSKLDPHQDLTILLNSAS